MNLHEKQMVDDLTMVVSDMAKEARAREFWRAAAIGGLAVGTTMLGASKLLCDLGLVCVFWLAG